MPDVQATANYCELSLIDITETDIIENSWSQRPHGLRSRP
jgi:hypothetical protein